ncbi:MAG TPA: AbrB/MazE/SpoVT family DNA-binding domain-containing protein [Candidatus Aminicenantes bacterium]|nr:AbrB/MazE/SpoVT family DNA-binding domain-containing protein [Candidatus Aminicenantes bacterium]HDT14375.1 AbrB/MazE/SpoVT family DNA-binding domain-containing protein [Candidatus Aminicenantes bacterium]
MKKARILKWGNSLALRIPKPFAEEMGWAENAPVTLLLDERGLVVRTDRERSWDLATLLAGVNAENIHPSEDGAAFEEDEEKGE